MSASSTTGLGNSSASADSALPKASRRESPLAAMRAGALPASCSEAVGELDDMQEILDLGGAGAQRLQRFLGLLRRELHAAMPEGNVFHIGHALALDGVGDDDAGLRRRTGMLEGGEDGGNVVAVNFLHVPAKGAP